jgi:hypothetical protein
MGIIEDHQVSGFYLGATVEVDPVVHDPNCISLVVVVECCARVVAARETVSLFHPPYAA